MWIAGKQMCKNRLREMFLIKFGQLFVMTSKTAYAVQYFLSFLSVDMVQEH